MFLPGWDKKTTSTLDELEKPSHEKWWQAVFLCYTHSIHFISLFFWQSSSTQIVTSTCIIWQSAQESCDELIQVVQFVPVTNRMFELFIVSVSNLRPVQVQLDLKWLTEMYKRISKYWKDNRARTQDRTGAKMTSIPANFSVSVRYRRLMQVWCWTLTWKYGL